MLRRPWQFLVVSLAFWSMSVFAQAPITLSTESGSYSFNNGTMAYAVQKSHHVGTGDNRGFAFLPVGSGFSVTNLLTSAAFGPANDMVASAAGTSVDGVNHQASYYSQLSGCSVDTSTLNLTITFTSVDSGGECENGFNNQCTHYFTNSTGSTPGSCPGGIQQTSDGTLNWGGSPGANVLTSCLAEDDGMMSTVKWQLATAAYVLWDATTGSCSVHNP